MADPVGSGRPDAFEESLLTSMHDWREAGLWRDPVAPRDRAGDFTSNDYLGLSNDARLIDAAREAAARWGVGGRASRLLGGGCDEVTAVERDVAEWLGEADAILLPSGFQANLAVVTGLVGPGDVVVSDALNHASLVDAMRLSRARVLIYPHADVAAAETCLRRASGAGRVLLVTESVFSMDGDVAPLAELAGLCRRAGAAMVIDEAHAVGLLGVDGAGAWSEVTETPPTLLRVVTGGKALGCNGALIVGPATPMSWLRQRARSYVFTTAVAPAVAAALRAAVQVVRSERGAARRTQAIAREIATRLGVTAPAGAIVPWRVGDARDALGHADRAQARGLEVRAVRPPTVPPGTSRLRIVAHAYNTDDEVASLVDVLGPEPFQERHVVRDVATATSLVVAGTDTGIGKTVVSALLTEAARRHGAFGYFKPMQTGDDDDTAEVSRLVGGVEFPRPGYHFALPASPHEAAAAEGASVDVDALDALITQRAGEVGAGVMVTELAGGLLVPWTDDVTQLDWMARRRHPCVLVARSGLGTLNHTLLSLEALRARRLEPRALFLVGPRHPSNHATLVRRGGVARVYEVPLFDPLDADAIRGWVDACPMPEICAP